MFFALAVQPLLNTLKERSSPEGLQLSFSFLDDLNLAGEQTAVAEAFNFIRVEAHQIGLQFNTSKCEVIPAAGQNASINKSLFPIDTKFINAL